VLDVLDKLVVDLFSLLVKPDSLDPAHEEHVHNHQDAAAGVPRSLAHLVVVHKDVRVLEGDGFINPEIEVSVSSVVHEEHFLLLDSVTHRMGRVVEEFLCLKPGQVEDAEEVKGAGRGRLVFPLVEHEGHSSVMSVDSHSAGSPPSLRVCAISGLVMVVLNHEYDRGRGLDSSRDILEYLSKLSEMADVGCGGMTARPN